MKSKLLGLALALIMAVTALVMPSTAMAANPTVTITVTAGVISIINYPGTWAIGYVEPSDIVYFSVDGVEDTDYAAIQNTGNLAADIEIQGQDIEGGDYDWAWGNAAGDKIYYLKANTEGVPATYDVDVKPTPFVDLTTDLAPAANYTWSMKFQAPTIFDAADDLAQKSATITLVASRHI